MPRGRSGGSACAIPKKCTTKTLGMTCKIASPYTAVVSSRLSGPAFAGSLTRRPKSSYAGVIPIAATKACSFAAMNAAGSLKRREEKAQTNAESPNNGCHRLLSGQVLVEPRHRAPQNIQLVLRAADEVSLARIHHILRRHAKVLQRVPEFARLRRRALAIALAHQHQGGRLHVLDERHGRAARIHLRVVVYRCSKIRHHPAVNVVFSRVAQPIGEPCP